MPTYEYVFTKCDHQFELFQSIADKPLSICPKDRCGMKNWGRGKVKKLIGAGAGLIFKGSGFYITDYRSEKYKEAAKKESGAAPAASTGTKSGAGGEAKPPSAKSSPSSAASSSSTDKTGSKS